MLLNISKLNDTRCLQFVFSRFTDRVLVIYWKYTLAVCYHCTRSTLVMYSQCIEDVFTVYWPCTGHIVVVNVSRTNCVMATYCSYINRATFVTYQSNTGHVLVVYWPLTQRLLFMYLSLCINDILVVYSLYDVTGRPYQVLSFVEDSRWRYLLWMYPGDDSKTWPISHLNDTPIARWAVMRCDMKGFVMVS